MVADLTPQKCQGGSTSAGGETPPASGARIGAAGVCVRPEIKMQAGRACIRVRFVRQSDQGIGLLAAQLDPMMTITSAPASGSKRL